MCVCVCVYIYVVHILYMYFYYNEFACILQTKHRKWAHKPEALSVHPSVGPHGSLSGTNERISTKFVNRNLR
jgi:hypothetical protein